MTTPEPPEPPPEPDHGSEKFQNVVRWFIIIFLAYVFIHNIMDIREARKSPPLAPVQTATAKIPDCNRHFPLFNMNLLPLYIPSLKMKELKIGTGEPAACGQKALLHYEYSVHNKVIQKGEKNIVIGDGTVLRGSELGVIGMKPGGERSVIMPPQLVVSLSDKEPIPSDMRGEIVKATLSLGKISPAIPTSTMPVRFTDLEIGTNREITCGDKVSAMITLWSVDGKQISTTKGPVSFTLGGSQLPYGIEESVIGMRENGSRLVVVPPGGFVEPLIKNTSPDAIKLPMPANDIVLVQIDQLHIEDRQVTEIPDSSTAKPTAKAKPEPEKKPETQDETTQ